MANAASDLANCGRRSLRNGLVCGAVALALAIGSPAEAQDTAALTDLLAAAGGLTGATTGPDLGEAVAAGVLADDPMAAEAIRAWYATVTVPPPSPAVVAPSPIDPIALGLVAAAGAVATVEPAQPLPAEYLAEVEIIRAAIAGRGPNGDTTIVDGFLGRALGGVLAATPRSPAIVPPAPAAGTPLAVGGCELAEVAGAVRAYAAFLDRSYADLVQRSLTPGFWDAVRQNLAGNLADVVDLGTPPLAVARDYDRTFGTTYWAARWEQEAQLAYIRIVLGGDEVLLYEAIELAGDASPPAYGIVTDERARILAAVAELVASLRAAGCVGAADLAHARAARALAFGSERAEHDARDPAYWEAFALNAGDPQWLRTFAAGLVNPTEAEVRANEDARFGTGRVEDVLGPLPAMPATLATAAETPAGPGEPGAPPGAGAPPAMTPGGLPAAAPGLALVAGDAAGSADTPAIAAAPGAWDDGRPAPGAPLAPADAGDAAGTWLSIAGLGAWPQPLAGFWSSSGITDAAATLLSLDTDRNLRGVTVVEGETRGDGLDMQADGVGAWRGLMHIALTNPDGACPRWTDGVLLTPPGALVLQGAWAGWRVNPDGCSLDNVPDGGPVRLSRITATRFQPIVPGKFIHLIGAPAIGGNPATYRAAVEFACAPGNWPVATRRVTASAGTVVELDGACRYQLVVDAAGGYDITVEFLAADGTVLHTDDLHADVPPIPGLNG